VSEKGLAILAAKLAKITGRCEETIKEM